MRKMTPIPDLTKTHKKKKKTQQTQCWLLGVFN